MVNLDKGLLKIIKDESLEDYFIKANFGLEKENVRVTERGNLALTPHPKAFGDREKNPYIKTDFSESQLEMVTPVCNTLEEVYSFICNLNKVVSLEIIKMESFYGHRVILLYYQGKRRFQLLSFLIEKMNYIEKILVINTAKRNKL